MNRKHEHVHGERKHQTLHDRVCVFFRCPVFPVHPDNISLKTQANILKMNLFQLDQLAELLSCSYLFFLLLIRASFHTNVAATSPSIFAVLMFIMFLLATRVIMLYLSTFPTNHICSSAWRPAHACNHYKSLLLWRDAFLLRITYLRRHSHLKREGQSLGK